MRSNWSAKQTGFTLVELLVALAIMTIMAALSWKGLDIMLRSREITQTRVDEVASLQNVMRQWEADLNAVFPITTAAGAPTLSSNSAGITSTNAIKGTQVTTPTSNSSSTSTQVMAIDWDGRVLKVMRRSSTPSALGTDSGLNVVGWTMRDNTWVRWQSPDLFRTADLISAWTLVNQWALNPSSESKQQETVLFNSAGWQIYFFRDNAWSNPLSSSGAVSNANSANPSSALTSIPDGIRIEVQLPKSLGGSIIKDWVRPAFSINRS